MGWHAMTPEAIPTTAVTPTASRQRKVSPVLVGAGLIIFCSAFWGALFYVLTQ